MMQPTAEDAETREDLLAQARSYAPPGFDVESFWEHLIEHLDATWRAKLCLLHDLTEGAIAPRKLLEIGREVEERRAFWNRILGPEVADLVRRQVARHAFDPKDTDEVLALCSGDPDGDAALWLYAFLREAHDSTPEASERRLRRAEALAPRLPQIWVGLARGLMMVAREEPAPKNQRGLFLDASKWADEALCRGPEHPEARLACGEVLIELAALSEVDAQLELLDRSRQNYLEATRYEATAMRGFAGAGAVTWELAGMSEDEEQRRLCLEQAHGFLRQAAERGLEDAELGFLEGQVAHDRAWLSDTDPDRRSLFADACRHFEAASEGEALEELVLARWGSAVVGLALLTPEPERGPLVEKAEDLFARAVAAGGESSFPSRNAAWAWLRLAAESEGTARRKAARRAMAAARQLNRVQPGKGDYLEACALSILGEYAEATARLISAVRGDPEVAKEALEDPDLEALWKARPRLRKRIEALQPGLPDLRPGDGG